MIYYFVYIIFNPYKVKSVVNNHPSGDVSRLQSSDSVKLLNCQDLSADTDLDSSEVFETDLSDSRIYNG